MPSKRKNEAKEWLIWIDGMLKILGTSFEQAYSSLFFSGWLAKIDVCLFIFNIESGGL